MVKGNQLPTELQGVTKDSIDQLSQRLDRCYSADRYEDFQGAVEKICLAKLGSDEGRTKIKAHATEATKEHLLQEGWKNKTFWVPVGVSIISVIVAIAAVVVALFKP